MRTVPKVERVVQEGVKGVQPVPKVERVVQEEVKDAQKLVLKVLVVMSTTLPQKLLAWGHLRPLRFPVIDRVFHCHQNHPWPLQRRRPKDPLLP